MNFSPKQSRPVRRGVRVRTWMTISVDFVCRTTEKILLFFFELAVNVSFVLFCLNIVDS